MNKNVFGTDLAGKVAVVTGAGGVLCSSFAKTLAAAGAEYIAFVVTEKGHYTFSANTTMVAFIFTIEAMGTAFLGFFAQSTRPDVRSTRHPAVAPVLEHAARSFLAGNKRSPL